MSTVATPSRPIDARASSFVERLLAAVPLASVYVWLSLVYAFEAWRRVTPWLFTDELEMTQISRAIATTGHGARRGERYPFHSLYPYLTAPVWWIDDVSNAYPALKYLDVLVMTAVIFPTYFLARLVVGRRWALFAAAGAGAIPSLAYSSWIVQETLAYPYAALCFFLIAKAFAVRTRIWIAAAVVACLVAPAVRSELVVIPAVALLAAIFVAWSSDWARRRRSSWSIGDWAGAVALGAGAIIIFSAFASHHWVIWEHATSYNWTKHRNFVYGNWAAGALTIGLGVLPLVAGLASLVGARGELRTRELRIVRCIILAGVIGFAVYTGIKAGYLSQVFETRVEERNLIYISPLLFIGTAIVLERRRVNLIALGAATAYALYLVVGTPYQMGVQLYSDALGLALFQQANRFFQWTPATAQVLTLLLLAVGVIGLLAMELLGRRARLVTGVLAAFLAVGTLAWNVTGEIAASAGTNSISHDLEATLRHPFSWVDEVARGKPTLYLGQGVHDQNPEWMLEFWNRSIVTVSSLDATIQGPGPAGAPNITHTGQLYWTLDPAQPGRLYDYAVEDWPCVDFAGTLRGTHLYRGGADQPAQWRLVQLTKPNRLRAQCSGLFPDGWSGENDSSYFRFVGKRAGWLRIRISRQGWPSSPVHVQLAPIVEQGRTPALGEVTKQLRLVVRTNKPRVVWLHVPPKGFGVRVVIDKKFVPRDVDPENFSDPRTLGALVDYKLFTRLPPNAKPSTGG